MARRGGGLLALRAALGAVGGGFEGYAKLQESQRDEAERARQAERQAMLDRVGLVEKGFVPESSAGAMDMPGAAPRTPFMSQVLSSGERMVMEQSPQMRTHEAATRKAVTERGIARAGEERAAATAEQRAESIDAALKAAGVNDEDRGLVRSGALKASDVMLTANQRESMALRRAQAGRERGDQSAAARATTDTMLANEAEGMEFLQRNRGNPQVMQALNTVFANRPELAQRPGLAGYALKRSARTEESDELRREQAEMRRTAQASSGVDALYGRYGLDSSGSAPVTAPTPAAARPAVPAPAMPAARPETPPTTAAGPALEGGANPFRGPLTAEEAARLGVDFAEYQQNPAYRQFVDAQR
jgi:hypothetical protein